MEISLRFYRSIATFMFIMSFPGYSFAVFQVIKQATEILSLSQGAREEFETEAVFFK